MLHQLSRALLWWGTSLSDQMRILVVDDNRDDSSLITLVLTRDLPKVQVVCAGDRDTFQDLLESAAFHIAITESRVCWASGFEVLRSIRLVTPHCPVLMFTAHGDEELASEAFKKGFTDYLPKSARGYVQLPKRLRRSMERSEDLVSCTGLLARHHLLFEMLDQAAFFATADGVLMAANPAFIHLLRGFKFLDASALKGRPLTELLPSSKLPQFLQGLAPGHPASLTLELNRARFGSSVRLDACLLDQGFRLPAVLVGTLGLREPARVGDQYVQVDGVATAQPDHRSELDHVVSHDLQGPVREVTRYARLLGERLGDADAEARRFLDHVTAGADRMRAMLDLYTDCLKASGRAEQFQRVELERVLETVLTNLRDLIEETKAKVVHPALPAVWGNFHDIVRLFQNLVENGLKFRKAEPPLLEINALRGAADWFISVKDNGIGIDERDFPRIFRMFQRLHTTEECPGFGMGLPICKRIVEAHGGKIWVESCPGFGSTFHFNLPPVSESHMTEQKDERNGSTIAPGI